MSGNSSDRWILVLVGVLSTTIGFCGGVVAGREHLKAEIRSSLREGMEASREAFRKQLDELRSNRNREEGENK